MSEKEVMLDLLDSLEALMKVADQQPKSIISKIKFWYIRRKFKSLKRRFL